MAGRLVCRQELNRVVKGCVKLADMRKTIAIVIAGGSGQRMGEDIPKQFINVYDKPVLIYTLEGFQRHPQVDAIEVVCLAGWQEIVWAYAKQFEITKLKWIVEGGKSGQESIRNGVYHLEDKCEKDDIIVIHDGIRPLVDAVVLTDVIFMSLPPAGLRCLDLIYPSLWKPCGATCVEYAQKDR